MGGCSAGKTTFLSFFRWMLHLSMAFLFVHPQPTLCCPNQPICSLLRQDQLFDDSVLMDMGMATGRNGVLAEKEIYSRGKTQQMAEPFTPKEQHRWPIMTLLEDRFSLQTRCSFTSCECPLLEALGGGMFLLFLPGPLRTVCFRWTFGRLNRNMYGALKLLVNQMTQ